MQLFGQIPCLNEEKTLPSIIPDMPRHIEGVDEVKILVIDDGGTDNTAQVAHREGADFGCVCPTRKGWRAPSLRA